jgi:ATP-binding cassette subfamily B protein
MTRLADMTDLYNRAMASVNRVLDLLDTPLAAAADGRVAAATARALRSIRALQPTASGRRWTA